jgi:hypothetical protein
MNRSTNKGWLLYWLSAVPVLRRGQEKRENKALNRRYFFPKNTNRLFLLRVKNETPGHQALTKKNERMRNLINQMILKAD